MMDEIERAVEAMRRATPESASGTMMFGVKLAELSDQQCRIAMFCLAGQLERQMERSQPFPLTR